MKKAMNSGDSVVEFDKNTMGKQRGRIVRHCSVCTSRIWSNPVLVVEPAEVPEPRLSWTLCQSCHRALLAEMERSPIQSPLRLRIALGLIASERWPHAYSTKMREYVNDRRWIVFMAAAFIIAMILHLVVIVMIAGINH